MRKSSGFTLIELVMVIVILGILSAVAVPTFFNLQNQAKVSAVQGALGGLRSGVAIWYANQAASAGVGSYPTLGQMTATSGGVMAGGIIPKNPYNNSAAMKAGTAEVTDATVGWIYDANSGKVWSSASETQGSGY